MKVICEDEEHHEKVIYRNTKVLFDEEEGRPKRVCSECGKKDKYEDRK